MVITLVILLSVFGAYGLITFLKRPKLSYSVAIGVMFMPFPYIHRHLFTMNSIVPWLPSLLVIFVASAVILYKSAKGQLLFLPRRIGWFLFPFSLINVVSYVYNESSLMPAMYSAIGFMVYLSYVIILDNSRYRFSQERLFRVLIGYGLIHALAALFERIVFVSLLGLGSGDMVSGFFSVDGPYSFYMLFCIVVVSVYWLSNRQPIVKRVTNLQLLIIFIASLAIANNKSSLLLIPYVFILVFLFMPKKVFLRRIGSVLSLVLILITAFFIFNTIYSNNYKSNKGTISELITNTHFINDYLFAEENANPFEENVYKNSYITKGGGIKRGGALQFGYLILSKSPWNLTLGKGPGATSDTDFLEGVGSLSAKYSTFKIYRTSYSMTFAELGFGGIIIFISLYFIIFFRERKKKSGNINMVQIRKIVICLIALFMAYENLFENVSFYLVLAALTMEDYD